ncbi:ABC transporter permease [Brachybacterium sp. FME24]|uniref:ABC transporter permease n=1 Tax=Brachybacterium sp. FME24 TaxID=2742605 RepID=UPI001866D4FB|nr:ABC transporter permease [Brachybacterium sp. FME24]
MIPSLQRLARSLGVLLVVVGLTFAIFYIAPIDPALQMCGKPCSPEDLEAARGFMGFDKPWWVQLGTFLAAIVTGRSFGSADVLVECAAPCLGYSFQLHQSVTELLADRFPVSFSIAIGAVALQAVFGIAAGALAARRQGGMLDRIVTGVSVVAASAPAFVVGLLAVVVFALRLDLLPSGGYEPFAEGPLEWARHLVLPWATLAFLNGAIYGRLVRSSMIEQLGLDYVRTSRALGLSERRIDGYALRNLALPLTTLIALDIGALLGGTVITERIFGQPGLGALLLDATATADLPVIVGTTLVGSLLIVLANLGADLARPLLDRRLAHGGRSPRRSSATTPLDQTPQENPS